MSQQILSSIANLGSFFCFWMQGCILVVLLFCFYNNLQYKTGNFDHYTQMLPYSHKPQILRLHDLEEKERNKFIHNCGHTLLELLPTSINRTINNSLLLKQLLKALPDLYYTLVTVCLCKRRLGQQYTYIAMHKEKHYLDEGVLLNKKTRVIITILEIVSRNLVLPFVKRNMKETFNNLEKNEKDNEKSEKIDFFKKVISIFNWLKGIFSLYFQSAQQIMSHAEWLVLMVYMLDWNKYFTLIETILGVRYVYTYQNDTIKEVSYAIQGYLLLATFAVKIVKFLIKYFKQKSNQQQKVKTGSNNESRQSEPLNQSFKKEKHICRICYDQIKRKSSTKCGHVFCWDCITKTVQISDDCPVCRTPCLPREIVQLRN